MAKKTDEASKTEFTEQPKTEIVTNEVETSNMDKKEESNQAISLNKKIETMNVSEQEILYSIIKGIMDSGRSLEKRILSIVGSVIEKPTEEQLKKIDSLANNITDEFRMVCYDIEAIYKSNRSIKHKLLSILAELNSFV